MKLTPDKNRVTRPTNMAWREFSSFHLLSHIHLHNSKTIDRKTKTKWEHLKATAKHCVGVPLSYVLYTLITQFGYFIFSLRFKSHHFCPSFFLFLFHFPVLIPNSENSVFGSVQKDNYFEG